MSNCLIDQSQFRHVLYKDLKNYLKRDDYLNGFTSIEQSWIRMNIGAIGVEDIDKKIKEIISGLIILSYDEFLQLQSQNKLIPGTLYGILNFRTIYSSYEKNKKGQYITWGKDINPSKEYLLLARALSTNVISPSVCLFSEESLYWNVKYDPVQETLPDGEKTMGRILYLEDENLNKATYDFKNIKFKYNNKLYYTFSDENGLDNSLNCYNNDICFSYNLIITNSVNNLHCSYSNIFISGINLTDNTNKQVILFDGKNYLDYLDIETLTHQFHELDNILISS